MNRSTAQVLVVAGVCLGSLGAAGFDQLAPTPRTGAWPLLLFGLGLLVWGGLALVRPRSRPRSLSAEAVDDASPAWFLERLNVLAERIESLQQIEDPNELHERIDTVLARELFELTCRHERLAARVGFATYASIWDGVATGERLLARAWSMLTDGFPEQARAELPLARGHFLRAAEAARAAGEGSFSPAR